MPAPTGFNNLTVSAYARNSLTPIADQDRDLVRAQGLVCDTFYPAGRYGPASFYVPRDVTRSWLLAGAQRVVLRNGLAIVYEGYITGFGYVVGAGAEQGREVLCAGAWGQIMTRALDKRWADVRTDNNVWRWLPDSLGAGSNQFLAYPGPDNRLKIIPKQEAWASGEEIDIQYTMPTGERVRRIVCNLILAEGGQAWEISLWRSTDNVTYTQMTGASGETYAVGTTTVIVANSTVAIDVNLATASQYFQIRFYSRAAQTPTDEKNTIFGEVTGLTVYSETSAINLTEIAKDIRASNADINSDESRIVSNTYALEPFLTAGPEPMDAILMRAAGYGDSSQNSYAVYLAESDGAATPDGKPVLVVEAVPALTDFDYAIRIGDINLVPPLKIVKDFDGVRNYYWVRYRDPLFDAALYREFIQMPSDDATLADLDSIAAYGRRTEIISAGNVTAAVAINLAKRQLALTKDPRFYVSTPITVQGFIRGKNGQPVPASQIVAGKRIKIENFLTDEVNPSGAGLTFIVTGTHYDDTKETCSISCGVPDSLAVLLAQLAFEADRGSGE